MNIVMVSSLPDQGLKRWRPFADPSFDKNRDAYYFFADSLIKKGCHFFVCLKEASYVGGMNFKNCYEYLGNHRFVLRPEVIVAHSIHDRTPYNDFPGLFTDGHIINSARFKQLGNSKEEMYQRFGRYMPESMIVHSKEDVVAAFAVGSVKNWGKTFVLKPSRGLKGRDVTIGSKEEILAAAEGLAESYLLQKFIDTSSGIPGIIDSTHDLRFIVINGKFELIMVRTPAPGKLLANVAQGGTIKEVSLEDIQENIRSLAETIKKSIDEEFDSPMYSIDFGVEKLRPYLIEINDRIGFPLNIIPGNKRFAEKLADELVRRASF